VHGWTGKANGGTGAGGRHLADLDLIVVVGVGVDDVMDVDGDRD
jgi:hypothetical protein